MDVHPSATSVPHTHRTMYAHGTSCCAARPTTLAGPLEIVGWPPLAWGHPRFFRIRLTAWQIPGQDVYTGTLSGSPDLFSELRRVQEDDGQNALADAIAVFFRWQPQSRSGALNAQLAAVLASDRRERSARTSGHERLAGDWVAEARAGGRGNAGSLHPTFSEAASASRAGSRRRSSWTSCRVPGCTPSRQRSRTLRTASRGVLR